MRLVDLARNVCFSCPPGGGQTVRAVSKDAILRALPIVLLVGRAQTLSLDGPPVPSGLFYSSELPLTSLL
jgi:hypothetical protein